MNKKIITQKKLRKFCEACKLNLKIRINHSDDHSWGSLIVVPKSDESLSSWWMRQAWAFNITPKKLLNNEKEYWLKTENLKLKIHHQFPFTYLDLLPLTNVFRHILQQRGLMVDPKNHQVDISKWYNLSSKNTRKSKANLKYVFSYTFRFCPLCWENKEKRYFKKIWRYPFILICLEHGVELRESCPNCKWTIFPEINFGLYTESSILSCRNCGESILNIKNQSKDNLIKTQKKIFNFIENKPEWNHFHGIKILQNVLTKVLYYSQNSSLYFRVHSILNILKCPNKQKYESYHCLNCFKTYVNNYEEYSEYDSELRPSFCKTYRIPSICGKDLWNTFYPNKKMDKFNDYFPDSLLSFYKERYEVGTEFISKIFREDVNE